MKTCIIELNEFSHPLLSQAVDELSLPSIKKLLSFYHSITHTEDTYESDYLEPWVQWVSIHTGTDSKTHKIKHLGDVPSLEHKQIWERLSDSGISTGVWGVMNGGRNDAKNCRFFLPDPWSFSEMAYPDHLNDLLLPLRYASKNYGEKKWGPLLKQFGTFLRFLQKEKALLFTLKKLPSLIFELIRYRALPFIFVSFLDELSTKLFLSTNEKFQPDVSIVFLNSIAHLMHHQWRVGPIDPASPMANGLRKMDQNLSQIFKAFDPDQDLIIALNGLSQQNTAEDPPWVLYRQKDHSTFLNTLGIQHLKVEAHMTHDAHIFFENASSATSAKALLESVRVKGSPLFYVEDYKEEPLKLFYKIIFTDSVDIDATLQVAEKSYPFSSLFKTIVQRTGKHIQTASLLSNKDIFPEKLINHEVLGFLEAHLLKHSSKTNEAVR